MRKRKTAAMATAGLMIGLLALILTGCDSSGGGDSDALVPDGDGVSQGVFVDGQVSGLEYETPTRSGVTDASGRFRYKAGEQVAFSLGATALGQAPGAARVTPLDLVGGGADIDHPTVTNMIRFMQGLDTDGDPENGIQISDQVRQRLRDHAIAFNIPADEFEGDPDVNALFWELSDDGLFGGGAQRWLRHQDAARRHMWEQIPEGQRGQWRPAELDENPDAEVLPMFVDEDGDGVCDYFRAASHAAYQTGHAFVDVNEDGICDRAQDGSNAWHGPGFVDGDGDGVCDYWDADSPRHNQHRGLGFVDENANGVNDLFEEAYHTGNGHAFVDADGNGVCDLAENGGTWHGPGFVDADADGVTDHWQPGGRGHGGPGGPAGPAGPGGHHGQTT